jgi:single-strand DNA-binding protein
MSDLNEATITGHLGRDPESKSMNNGGTVVSFSLASNESWTDSRTGQRVSKTEWHNIVIFNEALGQVAMKYTRKGSRVLVKGAIQTRKWRDSEGRDRYTTEIVMQKFGGFLQLLDRKDADASAAPPPSGKDLAAGDGVDDDIAF